MQKKTREPSDDEDQYLRIAIQQSMKTAVLEEQARNSHSKALEVLVSKKDKNQEEEPAKKTKKKYKIMEEKK